MHVLCISFVSPVAPLFLLSPCARLSASPLKSKQYRYLSTLRKYTDSVLLLPFCSSAPLLLCSSAPSDLLLLLLLLLFCSYCPPALLLLCSSAPLLLCSS